MVIWYLLRIIATRPAMEAKAVGSAELRSRFATRGRGTKVPIETAQMISIIWSVPSERTIAFAQERICLVSLSLGTPWVAIQFLVSPARGQAGNSPASRRCLPFLLTPNRLSNKALLLLCQRR